MCGPVASLVLERTALTTLTFRPRGRLENDALFTFLNATYDACIPFAKQIACANAWGQRHPPNRIVSSVVALLTIALAAKAYLVVALLDVPCVALDVWE